MYGIMVRMTTSRPMSGAKFSPRQEQGGADEQAVDQANEKLSAKVGDDVAVDLGENGGDFIFQAANSAAADIPSSAARWRAVP